MKSYLATGRRKTAIAQVRLVNPGSGKYIINKKNFQEYLQIEILSKIAFRPLDITQMQGKFDIYIKTLGGGKSGQAGAIQLGVARALVVYDETLRGALRNAGLMTRDPRMVERKKYGLKKARKRFQFSKR
ncbi:MAG: small subunit ribosomal protein [Bacteroidota bacterium]|nr:small subunit ribosomal protein [Bacteroidota bacterium]